MTQFHRFQVELLRDSLVSADSVTNTWYIRATSGSADGADVADWVTDFDAFYDGVGTRLSSELTGTWNYKMYDMTDEKPRVPILSGTNIITTVGTTASIAESAACLSFRKVPASGENPRRLMGRVFLGPLTTAVLAVDGSYNAITLAARNAYLGAAETLYDALLTHNGSLSVFSPTTYASTGLYDDSFATIDEFWMDNAPDVIRSRGFKATSTTRLAVT